MSKTVGVYCASSSKIDPCYFLAAKQLGEGIGARGWQVCNGGGGIGLMGAVSDAAMQSGGRAIGVIPEFMIATGWHHAGLSALRVVPDMHTRNKLVSELSAPLVAPPGGIGTCELLFVV